MLFLSYSVIHTSFACHFYFLQKTSGSEALFCTTDDVILKGTGKCRKQCTVACHAYYQMFIFLRMFLCIQQCLPVNYIKLHVHSLLVKVSADQCNEFL